MKNNLSIFITALIFTHSKMFATEQLLYQKNSLELAITEVWEKSPQIKGQEIQTQIAATDRWRRFLINEPQFQFSNADDNSTKSYGLSLTTAFPGKAFALRDVDEAKEKAQRLELFAKRYDLTKLILQSYLDCAVAQAIFELQITTASDLETVYKSLKTAYEAGHSSQAEKIGAELISRQAHLDLLTAVDKKENLCKKFEQVFVKASDNSSFSIEKDESLLLPDDVSQSIISELGTFTADQNRSEAALKIAQVNLKTSSWSQMPDLTFNINRNHYLNPQTSPTGDSWTTSYGISITAPLFFPFHETTEIKRLKSQAMIDQNTAELQKTTSESDRLDGAKEYQRSRARLKELRKIDLTLAEALVESTNSAYRAGKLGFAELILSRKTLADIRNQDIQLRSSIIYSHFKCLSDCHQLNTLTQKAL